MNVPAVREESLLQRFEAREVLSYDEFEQLCFFLGSAHTEVRFAIGDAIMYAEEVFGEEGYQALEALNLSEEAKREYLRVSLAVPRSYRRMRTLSWSHHRAVAALKKPGPNGQPVLDREAQKAWLKRAEIEGMSHHALREALRSEDAAKPAGRVLTCRCCHRPL